MVDGGCHVVHRTGKVEATWSPCAGIIIIAERVHGSLLCKVLPLALKLCLNGFPVHLQSLQASGLLPNVVRAAAGTLVRWREPR